MRKFIIGGVAAVVVALGLTASNASAGWVTRTAYRWDPACGVYIPVAERVWVPGPVVYGPGVSFNFGYRGHWHRSHRGYHYAHHRR